MHNSESRELAHEFCAESKLRAWEINWLHNHGLFPVIVRDCEEIARLLDVRAVRSEASLYGLHPGDVRAVLGARSIVADIEFDPNVIRLVTVDRSGVAVVRIGNDGSWIKVEGGDFHPFSFVRSRVVSDR